jgi:iron complex transport system substrate-binding protein
MELKLSQSGPKVANAVFEKSILAGWCAWAVAQVILFSAPCLAQTWIAQAGAAPSVGPLAHQYTDEIGRRVNVPADLRNIISLAPNLTETVFALGKGDHLAGDTDFCDYPPEAKRKPHVGGPVNPNLEQIVALTPGLVLATTSINRRQTVEALARLGLPVYITDPHSVDEMIASVERLGNVLHAEQAAVPLVKVLRARLSDLDQRLAGTVPRQVLFVVWADPLISIGRDTFIADALRRAGARSVVDATGAWPRISLEEVIRLQPEVVVFASAHAGDTQHDIDALRTRPGWRDLDAVRRGNIAVISDAINRPAPRMVGAIEELAREIHSESFAWRDRQSERAPQVTEEACACAR